MELNQRNCSLKTHQENDAILFCYDCKIYMCNKCAKHHNEIFPEHQEYKLDNKNIKDIFIGLCEENGHLYELKYFCKTIINYVVRNVLLNLKEKIMDNIQIVKYVL